ncbi:MAG: crossover junction endodeoxyribonuclease RuvC [Methanoregula sp.]|jgi:crossover junction endodeoxyribonuclease RuvC
MIVAGIDPGLARLGYGVIRVDRGTATPVCYGCIETRAGTRPAERILEIYTGLVSLFERFPPDALAMEKLFFSKNITSAMGVSEVRGVVLLAAGQRQIPVTEYTPNQVKQAVTGSGRADKAQMQQMITRLLHLDEIPTPDDAADGLSIALCHIHVMR